MPDAGQHGNGDVAEVVLVVDVANVVGSRPDGWWRDRAGAASRLLESLATLRGESVVGPAAAATVHVSDIVAVVEGAARTATAPEAVALVSAAQDGDREIVVQARRITARGEVPLVVTADRGLRARLPDGCQSTGPQWLNRLVGR